MFTLFINRKVSFLILLCQSFYIKSEATKTTTTNSTTTEEVGLEEQVQNKIAPILKVFYEYGTAGDHDTKMRMEGKFIGTLEQMGREAVKAETNVMAKEGENAQLKKLLQDAEVFGWLELMREQIEDFDYNNFPQPHDDDYATKKVQYDREKVKAKSSHDQKEEVRYQKFKYYLENPPNKVVQKLHDRLVNANISIEMFCRGVARAYAYLSDSIHCGCISKWLVGAKDIRRFFFQEDILIAMEILLDEMGVSKNLILKITSGKTTMPIIDT